MTRPVFKFKIRDPFMMVFLGRDVFLHYEHSLRMGQVVSHLKKDVLPAGQCVFVGEDYKMCGESPVEGRQHGWLCEEHYR